MSFEVVNGNAFYKSLGTFLRELSQDYVGNLAEIQRQHGDLVHWKALKGFVNFAFISDAATNRELFVRNTDALAKSPSQIQTFLYAAGPSVATAHGEDWRTKRKEANSLFSRQIVEASWPGQVSVTRDFVQNCGTGPLNAIQLSRRLAALTSSRGILGRAISLEEADTQIAFSTAASDRFNAESAHVFARPHWMLAPWRRELRRRKHEVFPIVRAAVEDLRKSNAPNDGLMNHYVNGDFITSNDDEMLTILVGLLMGAQDNIASAAGWVLAYLAHHPELQAQIGAEVQTVGAGGADLHGCALLRSAVMEVLRMRPPAPANQPRILKRPVEIAGYTLPKRTFVLNSFFNMHHNASAFESPKTFDPSRFLDKKLASSASFAPFGHGPRNCVAQGMAVQQLMAIVVGILQDSRLSPCDSAFPGMEQNPFLTPAAFKVQFSAA
ncbi:cytochrome P450 [Thalassococcus lentus]|uniref:Cytochrome P450 n=1 Tax=Thalassococcus lentus TaxID=1210524 RepID=A0ABT4XTR1_9RHOB|nr:cytochrome P450 [Thalassococcus lentus]MDA7425297.1 cytochrome P450 [Thalassococcus lentus]